MENVLTLEYYCSQHRVIGSQLYCPYDDNVLTSSVSITRDSDTCARGSCLEVCLSTVPEL